MKKNLLITTIGRFECLPTWFEEDRNFDIALIYYPENIDTKTKEKLYKYADFVFFEPGFKYSTLKKIISETPSLLKYDYYWMPDDDVKIKKGSTSQLFDLAQEYSLELCQPSTLKKNTSYKLLRHKRGYKIRYSNFVEVMCPLFSNNALINCLNTFSYSKSSWGLDFLWASIISENIGIIDSIVIEHTKEINVEGGALYKKLLEETGKTPKEELDELVINHNLNVAIGITDIIYEDSPMGWFRFLFDKINLMKKSDA